MSPTVLIIIWLAIQIPLGISVGKFLRKRETYRHCHCFGPPMSDYEHYDHAPSKPLQPSPVNLSAGRVARHNAGALRSLNLPFGPSKRRA